MPGKRFAFIQFESTLEGFLSSKSECETDFLLVNGVTAI